jgi:rSAM/selenodomain-associated transferase 2
MASTISVIIPSYNEVGLQDTVDHTLQCGVPLEIIIVDASSSLPNIRGARVVKAAHKGRAQQMNQGAALAKGDVLLFLHADTQLPNQWDRLIESEIKKGSAGGGFYKRFDSSSLLLEFTAWQCNLRSLIFKRFLGDNALFCTRVFFEKVGGFAQIPLMEDVVFSKKLSKQKVGVIRQQVRTSARRFHKKGIARTLFLMAWIQILFSLGVSGRTLSALYNKK